MQNRIFSVDNPKAAKAQSFGWLNGIHYMAPARLAGVGNLCGNASPGCINLCLGEHSGAAIYYPSVIQSRIAKARRFMKQRKAYMRDMWRAMVSIKSFLVYYCNTQIRLAKFVTMQKLLSMPTQRER